MGGSLQADPPCLRHQEAADHVCGGGRQGRHRLPGRGDHCLRGLRTVCRRGRFQQNLNRLFHIFVCECLVWMDTCDTEKINPRQPQKKKKKKKKKTPPTQNKKKKKKKKK